MFPDALKAISQGIFVQKDKIPMVESLTTGPLIIKFDPEDIISEEALEGIALTYMEERPRCKYFNTSIVIILILEIHAAGDYHKVKNLHAMQYSGFSLYESIQTDLGQFDTRRFSPLQ